MKCCCESPALIFNPNLVWLFSVKCRRAKLIDFTLDYSVTKRKIFNNFPWKSFYIAKARVNVNRDLIDDCVLVDDDGVTYPVFLEVPCGKCRLCTEKKTSDWETRCICETAMHPYRPLFITLTYRPECRPNNMDDVFVDFQKFMKRLRMYCDRVTARKNSIRFVAASEWTPKNHYPHIHMIVWGFPYLPADPNGLQGFKLLIDFLQNKTWQNGIVNVQVARDTSGAYLLKYIRKGIDKDCWFRASRRNGIGYKYALSLLDSVLKAADFDTFCVRDRFTDKVHTLSIPSYFKRIWFPTLSNLFPAHINKAIKDYAFTSVCLIHAFKYIYPFRKYIISKMEDDRYSLMQKYSVSHIDWSDVFAPIEFHRQVVNYAGLRDSHYHLKSLSVPREEYVFVRTDIVDGFICPVRIPSLRPTSPLHTLCLPNVSLDTPDCIEFRKLLISMYVTYKKSLALLKAYQYDAQYIKARLLVTEFHKEYIDNLMNNLPAPSVDDRLALLETNRNWIETHWMQNPLT